MTKSRSIGLLTVGALGLLLSLFFQSPADSQRLSPQGGTIVGATTGGGLVTTNSKLGLLTSCGASEILKWNGAAWACAIDGGASIDEAVWQRRVSDTSCDAAGSAVDRINVDGTVGCVAVGTGNVSTAGLTAGRSVRASGVQSLADGAFTDNGTNASIAGTLTAAGTLIVSNGDAATISTVAGTLTGRNIWFGTVPAGVTTAFSVTALGFGAAGLNQTAGHVVAVGDNAFANLTGNTLADSVAVGSRAGQYTTTGGDLVFVGYRAGEANTTGNVNTIVGSESFLVNTTGGNNTCVGGGCLAANTTGSNNTAIGHAAMTANTTGINNTALGQYALASGTTGGANTAVGFEAMKTGVCTGSGNTGIGAGALNLITSGAENTAVGGGALGSMTTANNNVAVGYQALISDTTGYVNTAVGHAAMPVSTIGAGNTSIGTSTLLNQTSGNFNTALGYLTGGGITTGSYNTIVGAAVGSIPAATNNMVYLADGQGAAGSIVFQARGGQANPSVGTLQAGSSNSYGTVTGIAATTVTLTFSVAYANRSRCFVQALSGAKVFTVTQSASAPVISCFDMAGVAVNCGDISYHCVGQ